MSQEKIRSRHTTALSYIFKDILTDKQHLEKGPGPCFDSNLFSTPFRTGHWFNNEQNEQNYNTKLLFSKISNKINLHKWKYFKTFEFHHINENTLHNQDITIISQTIMRHFGTLQSISFIMDTCIISKKMLIRFLNDIFRYLTNLTTIKAQFIWPNKMDDEVMEILGRNISHLKHLKHLAINISFIVKALQGQANLLSLNFKETQKSLSRSTLIKGGPQEMKRGIKLLTNKITQNQRKLETLGLAFEKFRSGVNDEIIDEITRNIGKRLTSLKSIHFCFSELFQRLTIQGIKSTLLNIKPCFKNLESLTLSFFENRSTVTDEIVAQLSVYLSDCMENLKYLALNFFDCNRITSDGVNLICETIARHLSNLENLLLNFFGPHFTDTSALLLTSNHSLKALQSLTLTFTCHLLTEEQKLSIFQNLTQNFTTLKTLDLIIFFANFSAATIRVLGSSIGQNLTNLESLSLLISDCPLITEKASELVLEIGKPLKNLRSFTFFYKLGPTISDQELKELSMSISEHMAMLQNLHLCFHWNKFNSLISTQGVKDFGKTICKRLRLLQGLTLRFSGASKTVSPEVLTFLGLQIKSHLKELRYLVLESPKNIYNPTQEERASLKQAEAEVLKELLFIPSFILI